MDNHTAAHLSDADLVATVERLARDERAASAALVMHLAEMSGGRLHQRLGYASLYVYCVEVLRLSPDEAYDRMRAAKMARRFPSVLDMLAERELSLTTIRLLAPHLTRHNHAELLDEARGRSRREVLLMLARRFPQPDVPPTILPLPPSAPAAAFGALPAAVVVPALPSDAGASQPTEPPKPVGTALTSVPVQEPPPVLRPLAPERFHVAFTGDAELVELVELARDLLRHAVPSGDLAQVMARAMAALVENLLWQKFAVTEVPRATSRGSECSRYIPASVKRAVDLRDRGRCTFVGDGGHRCGERAFVEFHHIIPFAVGGPSTADNLTLRCHSHNQLAGEMDFGTGARRGTGEVAESWASYQASTFSVRNENVGGRTHQRADTARPREATAWSSRALARGNANRRDPAALKSRLEGLTVDGD